MLRPLMAQRMVTTASIMMMIIIVIECYYYDIMAEVSFLKLNDRNLETHQVEIAARSRSYDQSRFGPGHCQSSKGQRPIH